ncbi:MAG: class I SAM-dependent methyltransferase [Spirochaetales bacterium]
MNKIHDILKNFYANQTKSVNKNLDNNVLLEREITRAYIDKFLKPTDKVLEIGSGLRSYTPYLLEKGVDVTSVDLFQENLEIMKSQCKEVNKTNCLVADILNLSIFEDNCFDVVLVFGPLSHLFKDKDVNKAIDEAIRVCKNKGYIIFNYLTNTSVIYRYGLIKGNLLDCKNTFVNNKFIKKEEDVYASYDIDEFNNSFKNKRVKHIKEVSLDGLFEILKESTNKLEKDEFNFIKDYQLNNCENKYMLGCSTHILSIFKKD